MTEHIVNIVNIVNSMENQSVATDYMPDDIAPPLADIVRPPEETLTICDGTDDISTVSDDTAAHLSSESKTPSRNGLEEFNRVSDDTDDIFGTLAGGSITIGATDDGLLPEYITTGAQLDAVLPVLCAAPLLAVDTETTGLDPLKDRLRLIQFALPDRVLVVDAGQVPVQRLAPVFATPQLRAFHNAKFDLKFLRAAGMPWPTSPVFDTMLAAQLLGAGTSAGTLRECGLAPVVQRYLHLDLDKAFQTSDWTGTLTPAQLCYAARDAHVTCQLVPVLQEALATAALEQVAAIECRCVPALAWLEMAGLPLVTPSAGATVLPTRRTRLTHSKPNSAHSSPRVATALHPSFLKPRTGKAHSRCSTSCSIVAIPSRARILRPSPHSQMPIP